LKRVADVVLALGARIGSPGRVQPARGCGTLPPGAKPSGTRDALITPAAAVAGGIQVRCRDRLGGLLRYYYCAA
jgi:hypothetical protein